MTLAPGSRAMPRRSPAESALRTSVPQDLGTGFGRPVEPELRDSSAQVWPYLRLARKDARLRILLEGWSDARRG